jgi:LacI family transcriptional regulator
MLAAPAPPTAFFTGNSSITAKFLRAVRSRGAAWPALVAFDDFELADMLTHDGPTQRIHLRTRFIPRGSGEIPP